VSRVSSAAAQGIAERDELVGRLQEENRDLARQLGYIEAQLQDAQEEVRALEAARAAADRPGHDAERALSESAEAPDQRQKRSWWRR